MPGIYHFFLLLVFSLTSMATDTLTPWHGTCTRVVDGDTLHAYNPTTGDTVKIRLWGIDAPENTQPYSTQSTATLAAFVLHKRIRVNPKGKDRYGRTVAIVYHRGLSANLRQLSTGSAWHATQYAPHATLYAHAQHTAQKEKRGLWAAPDPTPPWQHRRAQTSKPPAPAH